jgi:hypothetical protein
MLEHHLTSLNGYLFCITESNWIFISVGFIFSIILSKFFINCVVCIYFGIVSHYSRFATYLTSCYSSCFHSYVFFWLRWPLLRSCCFIFLYFLVNTKEYSITMRLALLSHWIILLIYGMALQKYFFLLSIFSIFVVFSKTVKEMSSNGLACCSSG